MKTILIMAGGTGGHIMPALAVADHLRDLGWRVVWMGNPNGMEARLVPSHGYEMALVRFGALRGKGMVRKLLLPWNLLRGFREALREIRRVRPDVVLGMGGFITFPGGMMAALTGVPLVLHEQNSVAGLANKVLALVADRILTGFPGVLRKGIWVGNPVRSEIAGLAPPAERQSQRLRPLRRARKSPRGASPSPIEPLRLLVIGGSLGAAVLNENVPRALALLPEHERPEVKHQSGEKHLEVLRLAYAQAGVHGQLLPFIDDMAAAYAWADLVICRAGAMTVAELAAAGVASILVPFPHAVDDHQTANARFLAKAGAAILLPQSDLTPTRLVELRHLPREQLLQMAERARALARPDATADVAATCMELIK
jgi:UDP-N-acetylglucosamine--N-acetylmuramyl-(pentapeptide) pyrophosphoryl-undecaprenol N-acetylglucosamine transferase